MKLSKSTKYILIIIAFILLAIVIFVFFNKIYRPSTSSNIEGASTTLQIEIQKQEAMDRKNNLPSQMQLIQMENNYGVCFHNDDCRLNSEKLDGCNNPITSKYYCNKNHCNITNNNCSQIYYMVCENNICTRKIL